MDTDMPLTPIAHPPRLLRARIEHRRDDHEAGCDRALRNAEEEAAHEKGPEALRSGMAQERDGPDEDVHADPLADGEPLERVVLRELEREEREVEDRAEPVKLILSEVRVLPAVRARSVGHSAEIMGQR